MAQLLGGYRPFLQLKPDDTAARTPLGTLLYSRALSSLQARLAPAAVTMQCNGIVPALYRHCNGIVTPEVLPAAH